MVGSAALAAALGFLAPALPVAAAPAPDVALRAVGTAPRIPAGARLLGTAPGSEQLRLDLVLSPRSPAELETYALAVSTPGSPDHRRFLTVRQFAARFGQTSAVLHTAEASLREAGLTPRPATSDGLVIPIITTVSQAARSLHTGFAEYRLSTGRVAFANTVAPRLPGALAGLTVAIVGLDNLVTPASTGLDSRPTANAAGRVAREAGPATTAARPATKAARPAAKAAGPAACSAAVQAAKKVHGWTYSQLANAYSINDLYQSGHEGAGARIALFELDPWSKSDIATFQKCYGTKVSYTSTKIDGGAGKGSGGEAPLDIETAIALAPKATLSIYDAPPSKYATSTLDELTAMFDADNAEIVSISYGACETVLQTDDPGFIQSENILYEQAATEGISVFAASGDTGSEGCYRLSKSKALAVLDPSSQPFVTAVGGTDLTSASSPRAETAWNDRGDKKLASPYHGAGGGGLSTQWAMPAWQSGPGVVNSYSSSVPCDAASGYCREVPDVSASADGAHPYLVYTDGSWGLQGGTSAATPLWAAMLADIQSANSPVYRSGFLNPLLYAAAAVSTKDFHDVTSGNTDFVGSHQGAYPATKRYDLATGLGSPSAMRLASAIATPTSSIGFTDAPGTGSPPARLGAYKVRAFSDSPTACTAGDYYSQLAGPTGNLGFAPSLECEEVGAGWLTWSNAYEGDVYWNNADEGGSTTITITLPAHTKAFYLYAEPDEFETFDLEATAQNGTTSGPLQVYGDSGAQYYGFYGTRSGAYISSITVTCDDDFAVGEFGIAG